VRNLAGLGGLATGEDGRPQFKEVSEGSRIGLCEENCLERPGHCLRQPVEEDRMKHEGDHGGQLWGIVLAGGEGNRIRQFVWEQYGLRCPKQYVAFTGKRSMLQHTLDRVEKLVPPERIRIVVDPRQSTEVRRQLVGRPRNTIIFQPLNRETGPGILLPLIHIIKKDPNARIAVFPSDHFILEEDRFMGYVAMGEKVLQHSRDQVVLLGVRAEGPETEYGWIEPGTPIGGGFGPEVRSVNRFLEKPDCESALQFYRRQYLWNTFVVIARSGTLIEMAQRYLSDIWNRFERMMAAIGTDRESRVIEKEYSRMKGASFSREVLERSTAAISVIEVKNVFWSDWGSGSRVLRTLEQIGKLPSHLHERTRRGGNCALLPGGSSVAI